MREKELKHEEIEASHTLGSRGKLVSREREVGRNVKETEVLVL